MASLFLSSVGSGVSQIGFSTIIGSVARDMGVSLGVASFGVLGLMIFVMALGVSLSGVLIDRLGVFSCLLGAQALFVIAYLLVPAAAASGFAFLVAVRIVQGLAAAGVAVAVTPAVGRWFRPDEVGRAMGVQAIGLPVGMTLGLLIVPRLVTAVGSWPEAMSFVSVLGIIAMIITAITATCASRHVAPQPRRAEAVMPLKDIIALPVFRYGAVMSLLLFITGFTFSDLAPGFLAVNPPVGAGYGPTRAGAIVSIMILSGFAAPLIAGLLVDKVFRGDAKPVLTIGWAFTLLPPLILLPIVYKNVGLISILLLVGGLSQPFISITLMSAATRVFSPSMLGRAAGGWLSVSFLSGAVGTMLGSYALNVTGGYTASVVGVAIGCVAGLIFTLVARSPTSQGVPA
jgi:MFS family permease